MKKYIIWTSTIVIVAVVGAFLLGRFVFPNRLVSLPAPESAEGQRGELGIDKNVNEATIDQYLGRSDAVYRDLRMLEDPGNYEAIGGDSNLSGYVNGFSVVPFPYIVNVKWEKLIMAILYSINILMARIQKTMKSQWKYWKSCSRKIRQYS